MYRKWKSVAALGMAVLIGCSMPMGTMLAAEENPEAVQEVEADSASDTDAAYVDETVLDDNGNGGDEINAEDENAADEVDVDDAIADEEVIADNDGNAGIAVMSVEDAEAGDVAVQEDTAAPVISITLDGVSCIDDWDNNNINYKYIKYSNPKLGFSASQDGTNIMFRYYLDESPSDKAIDNIPWSGECSPTEWTLSSNKTYVVYVKAEKDGKTVYARSCGIVVDTTAPEIVGVEEGKTYQEGTTFTVEDANLDVVMINETPVTPESDGSYRVRTTGTSTSCVIRAIDKAGHEKTCSITVTARNLAANGVISESGTYSLKAGTPYQLAAGQWQVGGDKSVYAGGNTFYVKADGNYSFTKR